MQKLDPRTDCHVSLGGLLRSTPTHPLAATYLLPAWMFFACSVALFDYGTLIWNVLTPLARHIFGPFRPWRRISRRTGRISEIVPFLNVQANDIWNFLTRLQRSFHTPQSQHHLVWTRVSRVARICAYATLALVLLGSQTGYWMNLSVEQAAFLSGILLPLAIVLFIADRYFRRSRLGTDRRRLSRPHSLKARMAVAAIVIVTLAGVLFAAIVTSSNDSHMGVRLLALLIIFGTLAISMKIGGLASRMITNARRARLPSALDLRGSDTRRPVVLLRSFSDDGTWASSYEMPVARADDPDAGVTIVGLEETLRDNLTEYGPLVAIAEPRELPQPGAARQYFSDDTWQAEALKWLSDARFLVIIVGTTEGLRWELQQIRTGNHLFKSIFVFPPKPDFDFMDHLDRTNIQPEPDPAARIDFLLSEFTGSHWEEGIAHLPHNTRVAYFRRGGKVVALTCNREFDDDFAVALHFAIYGLSYRHPPSRKHTNAGRRFRIRRAVLSRSLLGA